MTININIALLPGVVFSVIISDQPVAASRISKGVSFHNFIAEYLQPFFACSIFSLGI